jgi:hypothetical protein
MSTIKADTIVASDGTSPVTLTKQSAAKVWLYAPATVASISDSFNISSVDDDGTGQAGMNLTSSMGSVNYVTQATHQTTNVANGGNNIRGCAFHSKSASAIEARTYYDSGDFYVLYEGVVYYNVSAHGDLA